MRKLVNLMVAGAMVAGGTAVTATAVVGSASPAMACSSGAEKGPRHVKYADSLPTLHRGSRGATVLGLQMDLRDSGLTYLTGTGYYGDNTVKAVKHFQARHNLPVTGMVNRATWHRVIDNEFHVPNSNVQNPQLAPGAKLDSKVPFGMQDMVERIGLAWFPYPMGSQSRYDGKLLAEVKEFQQRVGLQGTGVFGARTTEKMNTAIAIAGHWGC